MNHAIFYHAGCPVCLGAEHMLTEAIDPKFQSGSRYFCESFYGHPCPTSGKNHATANACGCPSRPASFAGHPARGAQHHSRNDSTRCRKACIFTTQKALRENTCAIASGDYSTPVSQRTQQSEQVTNQSCSLCKSDRLTPAS